MEYGHGQGPGYAASEPFIRRLTSASSALTPLVIAQKAKKIRIILVFMTISIQVKTHHLNDAKSQILQAICFFSGLSCHGELFTHMGQQSLNFVIQPNHCCISMTLALWRPCSQNLVLQRGDRSHYPCLLSQMT